MIERAEAICYGAATIINAIATGKGAAFGTKLWTKAEVKLTNEPGIIEGNIVSDPEENNILIQKTVERVLEHFRLDKKYGVKVKTWSSIPIAKGLKSSSAAANAIVLATIATLNKQIDDLEVVNLGVDSALNAKVTITGAFDDACATYFGGFLVTDNIKRSIIKKFKMPEELVILFHVPSKKAYTYKINTEKVMKVAPFIKSAYKEAIKKNVWAALTLNGLIYSSALGFNPKIAIDALICGASAAGLCGKGPAVTVVVKKEKVDQVKDVLKNYEGEILETTVNYEKAKVLKVG